MKTPDGIAIEIWSNLEAQGKTAPIDWTDEISKAIQAERDRAKVLLEACEFYAARSPHHPLGGDRALEAIAKYKNHKEMK